MILLNYIEEWIRYYESKGLSYNIAPVEQPPVVHMSGETNGMYRSDVPGPDVIANEYMNNNFSIKMFSLNSSKS